MNDVPCGEHAQCINSAGSYFCSCASGYVGDGILCQGKDIFIRALFTWKRVNLQPHSNLNNFTSARIPNSFVLVCVDVMGLAYSVILLKHQQTSYS